MPAHLAAYLVLVGLIVWSRPPGRAARMVLGVTAVIVLVSFAWPVPVALIAGFAMVLAVPVGGGLLITAGVLAYRARRAPDGRARQDRIAHALLWLGLLLALPATFAGAYVNGAGFFCF